MQRSPMVNGVLLLDKPSAMTSTRALGQVKQLLSATKAGHGGTLDPMASGLLVIVLGEATAFARYLLSGKKRYAARLHFGWHSDTDDADGQIKAVAPPPVALETAIRQVLPRFLGDIVQIAPAYSALKYQGKPLYHYARHQQAIPPKTRQVRIDAIDLLSVDKSSADIEVSCGGGVYIRALARDLGQALGCGGYLSALRRLQSGAFKINQAVSLSQLENTVAADRLKYRLPVDQIIADRPAMTLSDDDIYRLGCGLRISASPADEDDNESLRRIFSAAGHFAGLVQWQAGYLRSVYCLQWTRQRQQQSEHMA